MKRYSNYEFICARWYNQIPIHWHLIRIKDLISQSNAGAWGDDPETDNGTICLRVADMDFNLGVFKNKPVSVLTKRLYTEEQIEKLTLEQGDILIEKSGGGEKSPVGRSVYFDKSYPALFANFMQRIRFKHKLIDAHFASYLLRTMYYRGATWYYVKQTTGIQNLDLNSMLAQERFPVPPHEEQDQIVRYLDWQVSKINRLIAAKRKEIALLREQIQQTITDVVYHGVDQTVNYQPVKMLYVDKIPEHWKCKRGKFLFAEHDIRSTDGKEELLSVSHITGVTPRSQKNITMFKAESLVNYKICRKNDIAANTMWMWQGAIAVSSYHGVISPSYNTYHQIDNAYDSAYLDYMLRSKPLVDEYYVRSTGIRKSRLRLYPEQLLDMFFPVPPVEEQKRIAAVIAEKTQAANDFIAAIEKQIEKINEFRVRMISDVVTGQVDVRGIKVPDDEYINNEITEEEFEEESENNEEE